MPTSSDDLTRRARLFMPIVCRVLAPKTVRSKTPREARLEGWAWWLCGHRDTAKVFREAKA